MNVYLRHEDDARGLLLTECGALDVCDLVLDMREEGVYCKDGVYRNISYQYVLTDTDAYAEIVIGGDPE